MLQRYNCVVTKIKRKCGSFCARVLDLDEEIECSLNNVDPDELHLVRKGAYFVWFISRYNNQIISFSTPPSKRT